MLWARFSSKDVFLASEKRTCVMRLFMVFALGVCLLFSSVPATADQAEDEAAIRKVVEHIYAALQKHDAKAYTALCSENFETWEGEARGRAAIEKHLSDVFTNAKDIQYKLLEEIGIVFVAPDVAIYKERHEITGSLDADGKPVPPGKRLTARVFVKKNGKWLFSANFARPIEE
jgi:uncharacterized protein (TIGR02246 family)